MARALRDAGFNHVEVLLKTIRLDGLRYHIDAGLTKWQRDAMDGDGMIPMAMQFDFEHRSVKFLKTLP